LNLQGQLDNLARTLRTPPNPPGDGAWRIGHFPRVGDLPLPQLTWAALGLLWYRRRRAWAAETVRKRLSPEVLAQVQAAGRKERLGGTPSEGNWPEYLPGAPEWHLTLDDRPHVLHNRVTGEIIDFELNRRPGLIDVRDFWSWLQSPREPGLVEGRLRQDFVDADGLGEALHALSSPGFVEPVDAFEFRIGRKLLALEKPADAYFAGWQDPRRRTGLAAALGDWPAACEAAIAAELFELADCFRRRAEECRGKWIRVLRRAARRARNFGGVLRSLAHVGAPDLDRDIEQALRDGRTASTAIRVIADDPKWGPTVFDLLKRGVARKWYAVDERFAEYLVRHGHRADEVVGHLRGKKRPPWLTLISFGLRDGRNLRGYLCAALRSKKSVYREVAAAVLALFDTDWSCAELRRGRVLWKGKRAARLCLAALRECRHPDAVRAVDRWDQKHPWAGPEELRPDPEEIELTVWRTMGHYYDDVRRLKARGVPIT
jgi:hypothetical protein